jgi:hypothetical protein
VQLLAIARRITCLAAGAGLVWMPIRDLFMLATGGMSAVGDERAENPPLLLAMCALQLVLGVALLRDRLWARRIVAGILVLVALLIPMDYAFPSDIPHAPGVGNALAWLIPRLAGLLALAWLIDPPRTPSRNRAIGLRLVATALFVAFGAASCSLAALAHRATAYLERSDFSDGEVPADFLVAVQSADGSRSKFELIDWASATRILRREPMRLRMSGAREVRYENWSHGFRVIEQNADHQIVEVWRRAAGSIETRYRVESARIEPLYLRAYHGVGTSLVMVLVGALCLVLSLVLASKTARRLVGDRPHLPHQPAHR